MGGGEEMKGSEKDVGLGGVRERWRDKRRDHDQELEAER